MSRTRAAVSLRSSFDWAQPGMRSEWKKAGSGLRARLGACAWGLDGWTAGRLVESGVWAAGRSQHPATQHPAPKWRGRGGIEPTGAAEGVSIAVLKTGRTTKADPPPYCGER